MTFVGTRPEVVKYVDRYSSDMMATLLLPAGVTSEASIYYKDEDALLSNADNVDDVYVNDVLPGKMYYNLKAIENFSFWHDIKVMFMTFFAVLGKEYVGKKPEMVKQHKDKQKV
jgi:lipopolysaccharide/colanic/teichoic acid biosynthesis glycosyltransferase